MVKQAFLLDTVCLGYKLRSDLETVDTYMYMYILCSHVCNNMLAHMQVDAGSQLLLDNVERYSIYLANALEDSENRVVNGGNNLGMFACICTCTCQ